MLTHHFDQRMNQRRITKDLIDLALEHGEIDQDRHVLNRKRLLAMLEETRRQERMILKAMDKGGVVVVENSGSLITTYTSESYSRKHKNKG